MKKFLSKIIIGTMIIGMFAGNSQPLSVRANTITDAEYYEVGERYTCVVNAHYEHNRYYTLNVEQKSHVSVDIETTAGYINIYNSNGKEVIHNQDLRYEYNQLTDKYVGSGYGILTEGTYYIELSTNYGADVRCDFSVQVEKQISLPKGKITSLRSKSKGQATVSARSVEDAIGYRVQYSTSEKFSKVKTIYVPTATTTLKGLKKGKRYYVKVSPYTVYDDGTRSFGQNSLVKTVVIKK